MVEVRVAARSAAAWLTFGVCSLVLGGATATLVLGTWVVWETHTPVRPNGEPHIFSWFPEVATAVHAVAQVLLVVAAITLVAALRISTLIRVVALVWVAVAVVLLYLAYVAAMTHL